MMLSFLLGFPQIHAAEIPAGIVPHKRQVVGTGATTTVSETPSESTTMSASSTSATAADSTTESTPSPTQESTTPSSESTAAATTPPTSSIPANTTPSSDASTETTTQSAPPPSTSTVPTTIQVTTTNSAGSVVTSRIVTSIAVASPTSSSDAVVDLGSTTINRSTLSSDLVITKPFTTSATVASTYTSYFTQDGTLQSSVITTQRVLATTGIATSTISPDLQGGSGGDSSGGLSSTSKSIIGGVVGGVGGAILVGGIAIVAWRLWGKKKQHVADAAAGHHTYNDSHDDSLRKEHLSPAQLAAGTGLERYQQPHVNTASNF